MSSSLHRVQLGAVRWPSPHGAPRWLRCWQRSRAGGALERLPARAPGSAPRHATPLQPAGGRERGGPGLANEGHTRGGRKSGSQSTLRRDFLPGPTLKGRSRVVRSLWAGGSRALWTCGGPPGGSGHGSSPNGIGRAKRRARARPRVVVGLRVLLQLAGATDPAGRIGEERASVIG
eukprot:scaffold3449_cov339-Prasinococcus_capsulatus_cf.AAC.12